MVLFIGHNEEVCLYCVQFLISARWIMGREARVEVGVVIEGCEVES